MHSMHNSMRIERKLKSLEQLDVEVIFNSCMAETKSEKGGVFNRSNMQSERLPSGKQEHRDGFKCGIYASLNWSMFVEVECAQPSLWD